MRSLRWRSCVALLTAPSLRRLHIRQFLCAAPRLDAWLPDPIRLGLDLRGGINLTLGADVDQAVSQSLSLLGQDIRFQRQRCGNKDPPPPSGRRSNAGIRAAQTRGNRTTLQPAARPIGQMAVGSAISSGSGEKFLVSFRPEWKKQLRERIMDQTIRTLRGRIDAFGVAEPDIRRQGDDQIQIQLPGVTDTARRPSAHRAHRTAHLPPRSIRRQPHFHPHASGDGVVSAGHGLALLDRRRQERSPPAASSSTRRPCSPVRTSWTPAPLSMNAISHAYPSSSVRGARISLNGSPKN